MYIIQSVCLFVCLFVCGKCQTTTRTDIKRSGIMKNNPESVLCGLKLPVFSKDIVTFPVLPSPHFYLFHFHFRLFPRCLTLSAFAKTASTVRYSANDNLLLREPSHLEQKRYCEFFTMYCVPRMLFILRHYIKDLLHACNH